MSALLSLLLSLGALAPAAAPVMSAMPTAEEMEQYMRDFERDYAEASALMAAIRQRREEVAGAPDLAALEAREKSEFSRLRQLNDELFRRRKRFRNNSSFLQVQAVASQVNALRADKPLYNKAVAYREAGERMGGQFKQLNAHLSKAHQEFAAELARERRLRRKARLLHCAYAGAAALLFGGLLLLRRRKPEPPPPQPDPRHRPKGPARLQ